MASSTADFNLKLESQVQTSLRLETQNSNSCRCLSLNGSGTLARPGGPGEATSPQRFNLPRCNDGFEPPPARVGGEEASKFFLAAEGHVATQCTEGPGPTPGARPRLVTGGGGGLEAALTGPMRILRRS
eukprot:764266-Hanusia_phi.AAC.4